MFKFNHFKKKEPEKISISNTFIGKDSYFEGDIKFFGSITIEGSFKGDISGEGTLIAGCDSNLQANIHVTKVENHGKIIGKIFAENTICIYSSGKIFGDIETPNLQIMQGALIKGNCNTQEVNQPSKEESAIISIDKK